MVATAPCVCQSSSSSGELALIRAERDELTARLLELEGEKCAFDGRYDLLAREKAFLEEQVARLVEFVGCLSQYVEALVEEKGLLKGCVEECCRQLETEGAKRENV